MFLHCIANSYSVQCVSVAAYRRHRQFKIRKGISLVQHSIRILVFDPHVAILQIKCINSDNFYQTSLLILIKVKLKVKN